MKKFILPIVIVLIFIFTTLPTTPAEAASATFVLKNPPPNNRLELAVGESYTFEIEVTADEQFIWATAKPDIYFPGRGVFFSGNAMVHNATSATLYLTITGKNSTAGLPNGANQAAVVSGANFGGGLILSERFDFDVAVTP